MEELQGQQERVSQQVTRWELLQLDNKINCLLDYLKGGDFWKPADIVVAVSELKALISGRNNQFCEWIQKTSCVVKTSTSPDTFDLMTNKMSQQISSWKQQNSNLFLRYKYPDLELYNKQLCECLSLQQSIARLSKGGEDHSQLLSKAEEELQEHSEKLSVDEKITEGRQIIEDRLNLFKRLEQSVMQCLRKQLIDLKRISNKYMEFLKQLCSLKRTYQEAVKEAKEGNILLVRLAQSRFIQFLFFRSREGLSRHDHFHRRVLR